MSRVALRALIGPLFVGHGTQKLFGWFGGYGLDGTGGVFESLGLRPGRRQAMAAGAAETAGGALIALGLLTPLAGTLVCGTMITAIRKVHWAKGPWATEGGFEYNAVLIAATAMLVEEGPGKPSVDEALLPRLKGPMWMLLSLGAATAGSYLATSERFNQPAPTEPGSEEEARFTREPEPAPAPPQQP